MNEQRSGSTLGVQARKRLLEAFGARGHGLSNLWLFRSYRCQRKWVLSSDSEFIHAVLVEIDPLAVSIDLKPDPVIVSILGSDHKTTFDAVIELADGTRECREIKSDRDEEPDTRTVIQKDAQEVAAKRLNGRYARIYGTEMIGDGTRFWNGVRIMRCVNLIRHEAQPGSSGETVGVEAGSTS